MALLKCVEGENCRKPRCTFVHPGEPDFERAGESKLYRDRKAAGTLGSRDRHAGRSGSGWDSRRPSSTPGWDPPPASGKGWVSGGSPEPPSKGGWGGASPKSGGWGASGSGGGGGWGNDSPAGGGWGDTSTSTGWGDTSKGWSDSAGGGWGDTGGGQASPTGWGNAEPSSRRTSGSFDRPKSPRKPPPTSPRGERARSPAPTHSAPSSTSKDRDRDRYRDKERDRGRDRDRDRDRDREHGHDTDMASPSRSRRSRRSPSPAKSPRKDREGRDRRRSPEPKTTATNTGGAMELDPPSAATSLSTPAVKESATAPTVAPPTAPETAATPTTIEMPISIPFARPAPPLGVAPLGAAPRPPSLLSSTPPAMPPPPPPQTAPPPLPPPPAPSATAPAPLATAVALPKPPVQSKPPPPPPTAQAPTKPAVERPYEWIELLETLITQNRTLQTCKQQVARAEAQEKIPFARGMPANASHPSAADTSKALTKMRDRLNGLQKNMHVLMAQFAVHMERFYQPAGSGTVPTPAVSKSGDGDGETVRRLSDQVSKLQSEMKLVEAEMDGVADLKKVADEAKSESKSLKGALQKEGEARSKAVEDLKKEVKVFGDEVGRVKAELERTRSDQAIVERVKSDVQALKDGQSGIQGVKQEVKDVKLEVEGTKTEVAGVKTEVGGVVKDVGQLKKEVEKLKKEVSERLAGWSVPVPATTTPPGTGAAKRNRNGVVASESAPDAMDVDDAPPAKRPRVSDATAPTIVPPPAPAKAPTLTTVPVATPAVIAKEQPDQQQLQERIDDMQDHIADLENELIQIGADVKERLEEFGSKIGLSSEQGVVAHEDQVQQVAQTGARSESAPPPLGSSPKLNISRAGRSSAPPEVSTPATAAAPVFLRSNLAVVPEEDDEGVRTDLNAVMGELVKFWGAEGEWPGVVRKNLCKALGVGSLDEVWTKKDSPAAGKMKPVNGRKEEGEVEEGWVAELKEEQSKMREEMQKAQKEREEQAKRMDAMMARLERAETALEKSAKDREVLQKENRAMKEQQAEQRQLLVHLQSVIDSLPKPRNGILSPESMMQDALRNGASPVQREVAAIKDLAVIIPSLMELAGIGPEN